MGVVIGIIGIIICYIIGFITCEYASKQGIRQPYKEEYYYGIFITCLTIFGCFLPGVIITVLILLYIMGK